MVTRRTGHSERPGPKSPRHRPTFTPASDRFPSWLSSVPLQAAAVCVLIYLLVGAPARAADIHPVRYVTSNGVTVLILEQPALPIIQVHGLIKAGGAQDPQSKAGLANLVSALLDEGTKTRSAEQIAQAIDFVGGSLSSDVTRDFTTVSLRVLKKDLDLGFDLLADIILNPRFDKKEFTRVRNLILGGIQSEDENPELVAGKAFDRLVFGKHPYQWPVNGTKDSLPNITQSDVKKFYSNEYLPNQTVFAIVGDITVQQVKSHIDKHFSAWRRGQSSPRNYGTPVRIGSPTIKLIDKELTQSTIILGHLGIRRSDPDYYAVSVMNYILGSGGFSSRLMDSIRDKQGLAYGVYSDFDARLMPGPFMVSLQTKTGTTNQAITGVLREIRVIREHEVSDQELADAKSYLIGSFPLRLDTTSKLARVLTLVEFYGLGLEYFTEYPKLMEQVTKADILRVAKQYLHPERYVLVVVGDQAKAKVNQQVKSE